MVTIDKENNELKLSKSKYVEDDRMDISKGIQNLAQDSLLLDYKILAKVLTKHSIIKQR